MIRQMILGVNILISPLKVGGNIVQVLTGYPFGELSRRSWGSIIDVLVGKGRLVWSIR